MRRIILLGVLIAGACMAPRADAQAVRVGVDPRVELMMIVLRLAGDNGYAPPRLQPYLSHVDSHFGPYRDHDAVVLARQMRQSQGFDYDAAIRLAIHLTPPPELRARVPLHSPADYTERGWRVPATERFLEALRRFAADSRADAFFASQQALTDSTGARMRRLVDGHLDTGWFARFFGAAADDGSVLVVAPALGMSGPAVGLRVRPDGAPGERWAIIGNRRLDSLGVPAYPDALVLPVLAHEVIHPYLHPVGAHADSAAFARAGGVLLASVPDGALYRDPRAVVDESITRAAAARYLLAARGDDAARTQVADDGAAGFVWTGELFHLLGEYERARDTYPDIAAFRPRLAAWFDALPERIPDLRRRFDEARPRVAGLSIENGSEAVDASLTEITVRFDRPLRAGPADVRAVPGKPELLPTLTSRELDATRTVLRLGVALQPGRAYELMLNGPAGGGLRSQDGVPLAPFHIRFRTRAAGAEAPAPQAGDFAVVDVRVYDGERVLPRATVVVREGRIASVTAERPAGLPVEVVDGRGRTLLPGLIDSHFHVMGLGRALPEAMRWGVTTLVDMFGRPDLDAQSRQASRGPGLADLRAAGSGATAPGDHGTQFGWPTPTLSTPDSAEAFVAARVAEGSDHFKIIIEPDRPTLDSATVRALADAAHRRGLVAVAHVTRADDAAMALRAGVDGLVHIWIDTGAVPAVSALAADAGAFVVPTLVNFLQRNTAGEEGRALLADARVRERLPQAFHPGLRDAPWVRSQNDSLVRARRQDAPRFRRQLYDAVADLHRAGVRIVAGTDAANWGMSPVFLHRELELLVEAGLSPVQALASATSAPADAFRLRDRGRIHPGLRADLVLVAGDPTRDITDTRGIVAVWKEGVPLRPEPPSTAGALPSATPARPAP